MYEDPETYEEDGTQHIVSSKQRRGEMGSDYQVQYNLLKEGHWLKGLKDDYEAMDDLKDSGRIYNGSDVILNNIEGEMFKNPNQNQIYNQPRYTVESSYIYIISKTIGTDMYFKVGEGGSGKRNTSDDGSGKKKEGPGRLGDANTFLPFGLNGDVGFRVHYIFFFEKRYHPNKEEYLNIFIEKRLHANLRYNFRSASITMEGGKPSEWYLIPEIDLSIFLGFIFDIISSYKIRTLEIWKLTSDSIIPKVKIKPDINWIDRMKKNPDFTEQEKTIFNIGTNIVIKHNYQEEVGSVQLFFDKLKGGFTLPIKQEKPPVKKGKKGAAAAPPPAAPRLHLYNVVEIIRNKRRHGEGNPLQMDGFYGIITNKDKTFEENEEVFRLLGLKSGQIYKVKLSEQDITDEIKSKFYIGIFDLLEIHKRTKYWKDALFNKWELKNIYNYYSNKAEYKEETYEMPNNFLVPPWFYNPQIQLLWAAKMTTDEDFMYHEDCVKNYSNNNHKYNWKSIRFFPEQFHGMNYVIERVRVDDKKTIIWQTNETVPVIRVMNVMSVNEIKPVGKTKKEKSHQVSLTKCSVERKDGVADNIQKGFLIELPDDYFEHTRNGETDDRANHTGKTVYVVKKVYTRTDHSVDLNPWIDVQHYPSTVDKRIFEILIPDFATDELKGKLVVKAKTTTTINKMKEKLEKDNNSVKTDLDVEVNRAKDPVFKKYDIIRIKPEEYIMSGKSFGEDETKRNEYHYATILKKIQHKKKDVQYEIEYFSPWDKNEPWGLTPEKNKYSEKHIISFIDRYAKIVEEDDESFTQYKTNLNGRYEIESIYDHSPKQENATITSHEEFIRSVAQDVPTFYYVRWKGYPPDTDNEVPAPGFYEDLPDDVKEYWARRKPYPRTRAQTQRNRDAAPQDGGGRSRGRGGRKTRKRRTKKNTTTTKKPLSNTSRNKVKRKTR